MLIVMSVVGRKKKKKIDNNNNEQNIYYALIVFTDELFITIYRCQRRFYSFVFETLWVKNCPSILYAYDSETPFVLKYGST